MSNVIQFPGETCLDCEPELVLDMAKKWGMTQCIIIGFDAAGELQFGGSTSDAGNIMLMLESAKYDFIKITFEDHD